MAPTGTQSRAGLQVLNRKVLNVWCWEVKSCFHSSLDTLSSHPRELVHIIQINTGSGSFLQSAGPEVRVGIPLGGPLTAITRGLEVRAYPSRLLTAAIPPEGP